MNVAPSYDRARAQRALADFRLKRRSATPEAVAAVCRALGYEIDKKRGKGSHWVAVRPEARPIIIPTGNKVLGLKTSTGMLTTLEEVFERDGSNEQRQQG
ncbi:MAG: hypothetical protein ACRDQ2_19720 [Gaiellales bacterium]